MAMEKRWCNFCVLWKCPEPRPQSPRQASHVNAANVVARNHADATSLVLVLVLVGGNLGVEQVATHGWRHGQDDVKASILAKWADKLDTALSRRENGPCKPGPAPPRLNYTQA